MCFCTGASFGRILCLALASPWVGRLPGWGVPPPARLSCLVGGGSCACVRRACVQRSAFLLNLSEQVHAGAVLVMSCSGHDSSSAFSVKFGKEFPVVSSQDATVSWCE